MGPQDETKETRIPSTKQSHLHSTSPLPDVVVQKVEAPAANPHSEPETFLSIGLQVLLPFLVAGMGMVGAGIYLDHVQVRFGNFSE